MNSIIKIYKNLKILFICKKMKIKNYNKNLVIYKQI